MADVAPGVLGYRVRVGSFATQDGGRRREGPPRRGRRDREHGLHGLGRSPDRPGTVARQRPAHRPRAASPAGWSAPSAPTCSTARPRPQLAAAGWRDRRRQRRLLRPRPRGRCARRPGRRRGVRRPAAVRVRRRPAGADPARRRPAAAAVRRLTWDGPRGSPATRPGPRRRRPGARPDPQLRRRRHRPAHRLPLHDFTCTDDSELVAFTAEYGASTPAGPGREVVLDHGGSSRPCSTAGAPPWRRARRRSRPPGTTPSCSPASQVGDELPVRAAAEDGGRPRSLTPAGPRSPTAGRCWCATAGSQITQRRDGFVHPGDPSFAYGFVLKRNPRTFAGVDAQGRTVLVTVDGRMHRRPRALHPRGRRRRPLAGPRRRDQPRRRRLDHDGRARPVISHPSDATGERPVGDALLVDRPGEAAPPAAPLRMRSESAFSWRSDIHPHRLGKAEALT